MSEAFYYKLTAIIIHYDDYCCFGNCANISQIIFLFLSNNFKVNHFFHFSKSKGFLFCFLSPLLFSFLERFFVVFGFLHTCCLTILLMLCSKIFFNDNHCHKQHTTITHTNSVWQSGHLFQFGEKKTNSICATFFVYCFDWLLIMMWPHWLIDFLLLLIFVVNFGLLGRTNADDEKRTIWLTKQ